MERVKLKRNIAFEISTTVHLSKKMFVIEEKSIQKET